LIFCFSPLSVSDIYKYKDEHGRWVYSDKKPIENTEVEALNYQSNTKKVLQPRVYSKKNINDNSFSLMVKNPFYAPIEIALRSPLTNKSIRKLVAAKSTIELLKSQTPLAKIKYQWMLGDSNAVADKFLYHMPFSSRLPYLITQAFNGEFSHFHQQSYYAVDIAMDVGTVINAVRAGTVIWVKDDFHMSGQTSYFYDKANVIKVLHEDGTFALYAHILLGTAVVKAGDKVNVGDKLARSGSSGYSTGPHLHFVIIKNENFELVSVPFKFIDWQGKTFVPIKGMKVIGFH